MAIPEPRLAGLMAYCRMDHLEAGEMAVLETLHASAVEYLTQAGVTQPEPETARRGQYDLCVNYLVLDGYERRDMTITGTIVAANPAFRRLLNQLKLTQE